VGLLGAYGRWGGVNWVWTLGLTVFHATFSIVASITLVELMFPRRRHESWAGRPKMIVLAVLLAADVLLGYLAFGANEAEGRPPYRPPLPQYFAAMAAAAGLVVLAWRARRGRAWPAPSAEAGAPPRGRHPAWFFVTGFLGTLLFFVLQWALPNIGIPKHEEVPGVSPDWEALAAQAVIPPWITMLVIAAYVCLVAWLVWRMSGRGAAWTDKRRWALVAGGLGTFICFMALLLQFKTDWPKPMGGMLGVDIVAAALLGVLAWRVWRREKIADCGSRIAD
jgi:drug/metabolite transporter (DMT)-like permease